jgi:hypothetical protein
MRTPASTASQSSCMTTASAPGGMGAPVKMRAAEFAASAWPLLPAGMRWLTWQHGALGPVGNAQRVAVHGAVVVRRHIEAGGQVLGQHAAVGVKGGDTSTPGNGAARASSSASAVSRGFRGARAGVRGWEAELMVGVSGAKDQAGVNKT